MSDSEARRHYGRNDLILKVEYERPGDLLADYLTNLARGGLFISTSVPFEIGQQLAFSLSFPGVLAPTPLRGVVRWRRPPNGDQSPGVGVEFLVESDQERDRIDNLMHLIEGQRQLKPQPFRVLLFEDNPFAMKLFAHALRRLSKELTTREVFELKSASDGREALACLEHGRVDLAIVDYYLPIMNGGDVIRHMRGDSDFYDTRIVVISCGGDGVRADALAAGADIYLQKPVLNKQLVNTLRLLVTNEAE